jgi:hypothetical protein
MPVRSTTSEYLPSPPCVGLGGKQNGRYSGNIAIKTTASSPGIKVNMCCAPATNGDRIAGLAPSQPLSAKAGKGVRPRLSGG